MVRVLHYSDLEAAYDDAEGIARFVGFINELRDERTIVVGTGDTTAPGVLSLVTEGGQSLPIFEAVNPTASTFGNHDFDYGLDRTLELVTASPQPWVSTNVYLDGTRFGVDHGVVPTYTVDVGSSTVGLFGVLDDQTPALNPMADPLTVTDPFEAGSEAATELRDAGAELVIALSHLGRGDERLANEADVDIILGGHVHSERIERVDGTVLTRPGVNGKIIFELDCYDEITVTRHRVADGPIDQDINDVMRQYWRDAGLDEPIATVSDPIERNEATVFHGESRIGNLVADAYRWFAKADIGLQNSGGIREGPPLSGDVTVADLISIVPFEEPVVVASLSGRELATLFDQARGQALGFGETEWWHAHVSGATITVTNDAVHQITVNGEPLDPTETYTVATTDYLLYSDTEFPVLTEADRIQSLDVQYEVLVDYADQQGIDSTLEGRIQHLREEA